MTENDATTGSNNSNDKNNNKSMNFELNETYYSDDHPVIIKDKKTHPHTTFKIHYCGWNARYDTWVDQSALRHTKRRKLELPFSLKTVLVEECDAITRGHTLHALPVTIPLEKVLAVFGKKHPTTAVQLRTRLLQVFETLLYKTEIPQYRSIVASNSNNNVLHWYGAQLLLRLVVRYNDYPEILKLLHQNRHSLFATKFVKLAKAPSLECSKTVT